MKKFIIASLMASFIACSVNMKTDNLLSTANLLKMNSKQLNSIKSISIQDNNGFKYLKNTIKSSVFNEVNSTTNSQSLEQEDIEKIRQVLIKYN